MDLVEFARELKRQVPIDRVVGDYVPDLRRRGSSLMALCPFHEEKTPSFHVNPEFRSYKCFGCGVRGDAINFVMELEKVAFPMAVELLAKRFDIPMPQLTGMKNKAEQDAAARRRQTLLSVSRLAAEFFADQLWKHPAAGPVRDYLHGRGLTPDQLKQYGLGFAPDGFENFLRLARDRGYTDETVAEAGLAIRHPERGTFYDRFRNRIIFPIRDYQGETIAFGGRLISGEGPKYLNSPETPLFHKGKQLYGLSDARPAIREAGRVVLVEGYMDWIALHSHGVGETAAGLGTALTEGQARLLRQITGEVVLHYDGDDAGREAMHKAARLLLAQDLTVRVAALPRGEDPDTYIRTNGVAMTRKMLDSGASSIDFFLETALGEIESRAPEAKRAIFDRVAPLIRAIRDPIVQEGYLNDAANRLGLGSDALRKALSEGKFRAPGEAAHAVEGEKNPLESMRPWLLEYCLLHYLVKHVDCWELFEDVRPEMFRNGVLRSIFTAVRTMAQDVREGADPPEDWYALCNHEEEREAMDCLLAFAALKHGEGVPGERFALTLEQVREALPGWLARLRQKFMNEKRREACEEIRRRSAHPAEAMPHLSMVQIHGEAVLRESRLLRP